MKRFRFTFLAICLLLTWLGSNDLILQLRNSEPLSINLAQLPAGELPQEWLTLTGGNLDLLQGINMSGTIEIDSFLIPLTLEEGDKNPRVWVETRDPALIDRLTTYYFKLDSDKDRETYLAQNRPAFFPAKDVTGMTADNLIADANRSKLIELLGTMGVEATPDVIFLSEGKEPNRYRGPLFIVLSLIGLLKFVFWQRKPADQPS